MNAKHTLGPWKVDGARHGTSQGTDDFYVSHGDAETVSPLLVRVLSDGGRLPTAANAALIAAAPDLLAACKVLRAAAMNTPALDDSPEWTALIESADAAIAKATT